MNGWAAILGAARAECARLDHACRDPRRSQAALLRKILTDNAGTAFGRAHDFDRIAADPVTIVERFRAQVPVRDHDGLRPWIERVAAGQSGVLTSAPVIAFEETGGSTSGRKLIPYTQASLAAFRAAVLPWLRDLADERPGTFQGRAYVALSPVARAPGATAGGIPIGLPSEGAYLGADLAFAFAFGAGGTGRGGASARRRALAFPHAAPPARHRRPDLHLGLEPDLPDRSHGGAAGAGGAVVEIDR